MLRELVVQFSAYPLKLLLQLLVHEHQSFDSATQITVTSGDDLNHVLLSRKLLLSARDIRTTSKQIKR